MMNEQQMKVEHAKCALSSAYFIDTYCSIQDPRPGVLDWLPFKLWDAQFEVLDVFTANDLVIVLKARQLGLTWVAVGYALWMLLFWPGSIILLFSKRDKEAIKLLERISQMHERLPPFLQSTVVTDNDHEFELSIGSKAEAFPTTPGSGRSETATLAIVDEADFTPDLAALLRGVKPTVDAGGQLILISTSNKDKPMSEFKRIWRDAIKNDNDYKPVFLPWSARPGRTKAWYNKQKRDYTKDDLWQEYPETPEQALAGRGSNKRFDPDWLTSCFRESKPVVDAQLPAINGLTLYEARRRTHKYLIAADTSEGNEGSTPCSVTVFDINDWGEVATLHGLFEPGVFAGYLAQIAHFFNGAVICVERNNHGHAVHQALYQLRSLYNFIVYRNPFDNKDGWLNSPQKKTMAFDMGATAFKHGDPIIRDRPTLDELGNIESATLHAPEGMTDDRAMSYVVGLAGMRWPSTRKRQVGKGRRRVTSKSQYQTPLG